MPTEYRYVANCCGDEHTEVDHLQAGEPYRDWCNECGWWTTWTCAEKIVVDQYGDVL